MRILKPKKLRRGEVMGLPAPASLPKASRRIEGSVRYLEGLGYRVKVGRHLEARHGYLAGRDEERAADLNDMLGDPGVRAVFGLRAAMARRGCCPGWTMRRRDAIRKSWWVTAT